VKQEENGKEGDFPMKQTRVIEGVLQMRFEEIYDRFSKSKLTTSEAAELLGISVRTFLRKRERFDEEGFKGSYDLRLGKPSPRRASERIMTDIIRLYGNQYRGFNVKHFHEFAKREHGLQYGYTWTKKVLETAGLIRKGKRGGDHRLRRERRPMEGMMIHQDGSTHNWIPGLGYNIDLIVTMDDATSRITSAFFVLQEGTESTFRGLQETIEKYGLFCSLYTDRGSHYWYTPEVGGKVDKYQLTQVGRALKQLGIQHIASYCPQGRGRSERMFGTLQGRLPNELALQGITTMEDANRYLQEVYLPRHNSQFMTKARESETVWTPWIGMNLQEVLCIQAERVVHNDNTVIYHKFRLQIPSDDMRHHYVRTTVQVRQYMDGRMGLFYGHRMLGLYDQQGQLITQSAKDKEAA
jgi:transposase